MESRLVYQYGLAHATEVPSLQAKYLGKFEESMDDVGSEMPETVTGRVEIKRRGEKCVYDLSKEGLAYNVDVCCCCRRVLVVGLSGRLRVKYSKDGKRLLVLWCKMCGARTTFMDVLEGKGRRGKGKVPKVSSGTTGRTIPSTKVTKPSTSTSTAAGTNGRRRNKKKSLSAMVQKKQKSAKDKERQSLDLFDFMQ